MRKRGWLGILALFPAISVAFTQGSSVTADELVAGHLESIGHREDLKGLRSRVLNGTATVQFLQGMSGNQSNGEFLLASEANRVGLVLLFGALEYPGEKFAFDGKDVAVSLIKPGQRSPIAEFVYRYNGFVREGLLGGVLSTAWPFLNLKEKGAELKCGEGALEGLPVYEVSYRPKKSLGDLKIKLFFDRKNFRHLKSEYSAAISNDMTATRNVVSSIQRTGELGALGQLTEGAVRGGFSSPNATIMEGVPNSYYMFIEKFDDFQTVGGLTLPYSYAIQFEIQGQGSTFLARWTMRAAGKFTNNGQIEPDFFKSITIR